MVKDYIQSILVLFGLKFTDKLEECEGKTELENYRM